MSKLFLNGIIMLSLIGLITSCNNVQMVDFKKLNLTKKPNYYLICPINYCNVTPNDIAIQYPVSVEKLQLAWQQMLAKQPRVRLVNSVASENKYQYVQYSLVFRFPDYIDIQFIAVKPQVSTLAIYSRARLGYSDFHVNERRIKRWLTILPNYFKN